MAAARTDKLTSFVAQVLELFWTCCILQLLISVACHVHDEFDGFLLCRRCGCEVARVQDVISIPSVQALRQRNDTIFPNRSILVQLFKNPQEMYFEVITSSKAEIEKSPERFITDTWFHGYTWSIAKCPRCGAHVGWSFNAVSDAVEAGVLEIRSFIALIMGRIMHEYDVNNLIAMPKTYAS